MPTAASPNVDVFADGFLGRPSLRLTVFASAPEESPLYAPSPAPLSDEEAVQRRAQLSIQYLTIQKNLAEVRSTREGEREVMYLAWVPGAIDMAAAIAGVINPATAPAGEVIRSVASATEKLVAWLSRSAREETYATVDAAQQQSAAGFVKIYCAQGDTSQLPFCNATGQAALMQDPVLAAQQLAKSELTRISHVALSPAAQSSGSEDFSRINERIDAFSREFDAYQTRSAEAVKELTDRTVSFSEQLTEFSKQLEEQHSRLERTQANLDKISDDMDFLKEIAFGQLTASQQLKAIDEGKFRPSDDFDRRKVELRAAADQLRSYLVTYVGGARTVLTFAQNLRNGGLGIGDEDLARTAEIVEKCEALGQAALMATTGPMGAVGAVNFLFAAFGTQAGPDSQTAQVIAAIQAVGAEVRSSRRQILGNLESFRADNSNRLSRLQSGQDRMQSSIIGIDRRIQDISQQVSDVQSALNDMQERAYDFETTLLHQIYNIQRGIWTLIAADSEQLRRPFGHLSYFANQCRTTFPEGFAVNYASAAEFFEGDSGGIANEWHLADNFMAEAFRPDNPVSILFLLDMTESSNFFKAPGQTTLFVDQVAGTAIQYVKQLSQDQTLTSRSYVRLFDPVFSVSEFFEKAPLFEIEALTACVMNDLPFGSDLCDPIDSNYLTAIAQDMVLFVPWYELVADRTSPRTLRTLNDLKNRPQGNRRGLQLLHSVKRLLDIAIFQQNVLAGGCLLPEMRSTILGAQGYAAAAALEQEVNLLSAQIEAPNRELARYQSYIDVDNRCAAAYDKAQLDQQLRAAVTVVESLVKAYQDRRRADTPVELRAFPLEVDRIIERELIIIDPTRDNQPDGTAIDSRDDPRFPRRSEQLLDIEVDLRSAYIKAVM